jgi:hypothetical protein
MTKRPPRPKLTPVSAILLSLHCLGLSIMVSGCGSTSGSSVAVPTPVINPAGGSFTSAQTVTLTDAMAGTTIYYTTNGTGPTTSSMVYTGPITVSSTGTVEAIAVGTPQSVSAVARASFSITQPVTATPVISPTGGAFTGAQTVTMTDATAGASIYYTTNGTGPTTSSMVYTGPITVSSTGTVAAMAVASGYSASGVASASFTITQPVTATPVISPAGGAFGTAQTVTMTDATAGTVIYYSTDGSTPTAASGVYTGPFTVGRTETVKALASSAYGLSQVATAVFTVSASGSSVSGVVMMGGKPLAGASVQMVAAGTSGYGSTGSFVSASPVLTDASGSFTLAYACGSASSQVYLVSAGGEGTYSGQTVGGSVLALTTVLGSCGTIAGSATVNEITTVAAAWSLAQFVTVGTAAGGSTVGTSSGNVAGLTNAFLTAMNLVDPVHGTIGGAALPAGATLPSAELDTLADALASCVLNGLSVCSGLFAAATPSGGVAPVDTFAAAVEIALNPGNNVAALYALAGSASPYQPRLVAAPTDWTLPIRFSGGGLNEPTALAFDGSGDLWVADYDGAVTKLSAQGTALSPSAGFTGGGLLECYGLTVDGSGHVWVTNQQGGGGNGSVTELDSSGAVLRGIGGVYFPQAAAADSAGNVWIANYGSSNATLLSPAGTVLSPANGYGVGSLSFPAAVTIGANRVAWFANEGGYTISGIGPDGTLVATVNCCDEPGAIAADQAGNLWVGNFLSPNPSVSEVSSSGSVISAGYAGGGLMQPGGVAVDGAGNIWALNYGGGTLTKLEGANGSHPGLAISGSNGFGRAGLLSKPYALAIDATGSIWVSSKDNAVVQYVGAAVPVKTPLLGPPVLP